MIVMVVSFRGSNAGDPTLLGPPRLALQCCSPPHIL